MDDPSPPTLDTRIALELDDVRRRLETLAVRLCLDPAVFERHGADLQQFDHLAQIIGEVAMLIRHRDTSPNAVASVKLESLLMRLTG